MSGTDLLAEYQTHLSSRGDLSSRSKKLYQDHLEDLRARCAAFAIAPERVAFHHAQRWLVQMHAAGLSKNSMALRLSSWRGFYVWLLSAGHIAEQPLADLRPPKAAKPLPKALGIDEAVSLANFRRERGEVPDEAKHAWLEARDVCIVELLYGAGLRVAELMSLDVRPNADSVSWIIAEGELLRLRVQGKRGKVRFVPLGREAGAAIANWLVQRNSPALWLFAKPHNSAFFLNLHGARLSDAQIRAILKKRALQAGLASSVHPHMLRHSYASHLLQSSQDLRSVQELLGHASISATQVYTRLDFQHLAKVYDKAHPRQRTHSKP